MKETFKILLWIMIIAGAATLAKFFFLREAGQPTSQTQNNVSGPQQPEATATENTTLPETAQANNSDSNPQKENTNSSRINTLPTKFLMDMPFYSQAPLLKWDAFHEEMCEEASVLNAALYLEGKKLTKDQFEAELQKMQNAEKNEIGEWKSTTIAQMKEFIDIYFGGKIKSEIIDNPSIENIEVEVAAGNPVIVPLAGRDISNTNFTPPGPIYHMLVVKGYDAVNFITNDVGTRKGESYIYKKEVIMKNMHDWNPHDIHLGAKRILVLFKISNF